MRRGFSSKEILLCVIVVLVVAAVMIPLAMSMQIKDSEDSDVMRMRRLYMTLAIYESENADTMPKTLEQARYLVAETMQYESTKDPYVGTASAYPVDAGLPDFQVDAKSRISWTYVYAYVAAKKQEVPDWYEYKYDRSLGFLANEWLGSVTPRGNFQAEVAGKIYRLNNDGALFVAERAEMESLGSFDSLFKNSSNAE